MDTAVELLQRIGQQGLTYSEQVGLRCALSRELEEAENYDAARDALGQLWQGIGKPPDVRGLDEKLAAVALLRVGVISGCLRGTDQTEGGPQSAQDLITQSLFVFERLALR